MKEKTLIVLVCLLAAAAVSYGMIEEDNGVFLIGVVFLAGGYLQIRRRLKAWVREKRDDRF